MEEGVHAHRGLQSTACADSSRDCIDFLLRFLIFFGGRHHRRLADAVTAVSDGDTSIVASKMP